MQTNWQVERYIRMLTLPLRLYVPDDQQNWDTYVQPLTYGYNCQPHWSTNIPRNSLAPTWQPLGPVTIANSTALPPNTITPTTPNALHIGLLVQRAGMSPNDAGKLITRQSAMI